MIKINLLPKELQEKKLELPDVSFLGIVAVFLGIIIIIHMLLSVSVNLKTRTLARLEKKWQEIQPKKEQADNLKRELAVMRTKIETVDKLLEGRMSWAKKLSDLNDAVIPAVWLNRLWLEKKSVLQKVELKGGKEGAAPSKTMSLRLHLNGSVIATGGEETAAIGRFIRSLKSNQEFFADFETVESAAIQRKQMKDIEVMDFELI